MNNHKEIIVRQLGTQEYTAVLEKMKSFTHTRKPDTTDELWVVEHPAVFTLGQAGKEEHITHTSSIPIIRVDRGGQVTFHGPGQIVCYCLLDIKRAGISIRELVTSIEQSIINMLKENNITSGRRNKAPGVYINNEKIAAIGLRIHRGKSYHGFSFNVDMDLSPFNQINPCGYKNLKVTQLINHAPNAVRAKATEELLDHLLTQLGYNVAITRDK